MSADPTPCSLSTSPASSAEFLRDVLEGLSRGVNKKSIPSRYLYDERGCELFDEICETPEYYPTRTEVGILRRDAKAMAAVCGSHCRLIELGSGSSLKTELLLDHLEEPAVYMPVDFSNDYLEPSVERLQSQYSDLTVEPVCADFTEPFEVDTEHDFRRTVVYFPGSTIGNFHREQAVELLARMRRICGEDGGVLIGIDLKKDVGVLEDAYNDEQGVTAEFTSNLLRRFEIELDAQVVAHQFEHLARYNVDRGRIEIFLRSLRDQEIRIDDQVIEVEAGELINTEYSYKYSLDDVQELAGAADMAMTHAWLDQRNWFGVFFLS